MVPGEDITSKLLPKRQALVSPEVTNSAWLGKKCRADSQDTAVSSQSPIVQDLSLRIQEQVPPHDTSCQKADAAGPTQPTMDP